MASAIFDVASFAYAHHLAASGPLGIGINPWVTNNDEARWFFRYLRQYQQYAQEVSGISGLFTMTLQEMRDFFISHGYSADPVREPFHFGAAAVAQLAGRYASGQTRRYWDTETRLTCTELLTGVTVYRLGQREMIYIIDTQPDSGGIINHLVVTQLRGNDVFNPVDQPLEMFAYGLEIMRRLPDAAEFPAPVSVAVPMFDLQSVPNVDFLLGSSTIDALGVPCVINQAFQQASLAHNESGFLGKVISYLGGTRMAIERDREAPLVIRPPFFAMILQSRKGVAIPLPLLPSLVDIDVCREPKPESME